MSRRVSHDGQGALEVRFGFDRRLVDLVKSLPARRWMADRKFWWVPETDVVALVELLHPEGFAFDEATRGLYVERGGRLELGLGPPRDESQRGLWDRPSSPAARTSDASFADLAPIGTAPGPDDYTVARVNREVRAAIEAAFPQSIWVVGEIANFNKSAHKRHVGFALLDRGPEGGPPVAEAAAILFADVRSALEAKLRAAGDPFRLEDEIQVRVRVGVELYETWGQYRLRVEDIDVGYTLGEAARRREEIVRRLGEQGLLELNRALPFPDLPLRVGLVTSLGSDAFNDVLKTLRESAFAFRVTVHGARVQGRQTEPSVLNALDWFRERRDAFDVVLVCRGGGSRTDLAWFDSEALGRAVATFPLPVVVGIGHEQDHSVLDFVGWRAKTPTAAAALLVERVREALEAVENRGEEVVAAARALLDDARRGGIDRARRLVAVVRALVDLERADLRRRRERAALAARGRVDAARRELARAGRDLPRAARRLLDRVGIGLDQSVRQMSQGARRDLAAATRRIVDSGRLVTPRAARLLEHEQERIGARERRLHLGDPRRVVERGYAVLRLVGGGVVTDPSAAPAGAALAAELRGGELRVRSEGAGPRPQAKGRT